MRSKALDALVAELGVGASERLSAVFTPSFHPECGIVLVRGPDGWTGSWVATLRPSGDAVLRWIDPTTSREPLATPPDRLEALADMLRAATVAPPAGPRSLVLDGCRFTFAVEGAGARTARSDNLAQPGAQDARQLAMTLCDLADETARWHATRDAFAALRGYVG